MDALNRIINSVFDLFFSLFGNADPFYGLCVISFLTTIAVLPIFKYASNQGAIKKTKSRMIGYIFEIRLFKDDLRMVLSAQKNILKYNFIYMAHMLKPLLFVIVPVMIIIIQTGVRYEYRPLNVKEEAVVKVTLDNEKKLTGKGDEVVLSVPEGLKVETPALRTDDGKEIYWRISAEKEGEYDLKLKVFNDEVTKKVFVSSGAVKLSPKITEAGFVNAFFYPGEPHISKQSVVKSFEVRYPAADVQILKWKINWLVLFFILTMVFGFMLMKPFKVNI